MKKIKLTQGLEAIVDDDDFEFLSKWKWYPSRGYAISGYKRQKMHRIIIGAKKGQIVDHIDRDKLNNRKENLRIVDHAGNTHNQKKRANTRNKYKGVQYIHRLGLYQSRCRIYGNDYFLGFYSSDIAAAYAYNKKASELSDCILLNDIGLPTEILEQKLVSDRREISPAEKTSDQKGVYWHKKSGRMKCGKWEVRIRINGKYKSFGRFIDKSEAEEKAKKIGSILFNKEA